MKKHLLEVGIAFALYLLMCGALFTVWRETFSHADMLIAVAVCLCTAEKIVKDD